MKHELSKERLKHYAALPSQPFDEGASVFMYEVREMARAILAAHEQGPVMEVRSHFNGEYVCRKMTKGTLKPGVMLYTHPAPSIPAAVPDELRNRLKAQGIEEVLKDANDYAPLTAGQWETLTNNWHQTFIGLAERYAELDTCRAAMLNHPSSNEASTAADVGGEIKQTASNSCWCRTCRPVNLSDMRFVVCPDCGNKRCPKANDHRNACSGSNEQGQEGSACPAAPKV